MRRRGLTIIVAVLLIAGCSGNGPADPPDETPPSSTVSTPAQTSTTAPPDAPGEAPSIAGNWTVTHYASAETNGITNLWPDTEITLIIGDDGSISGNAGCNDYSGFYTVSGEYLAEPSSDEEVGQAIEVGEVSSEAADCPDENTMTQEGEFLDVLGRAEYWNIGSGFGEGDMNLILRSVESGLLIQASPEA
jgi:heat shock protein HslJ